MDEECHFCRGNRTKPLTFNRRSNDGEPHRGWQNYFAWASQSTVVVLEPQSVQVLQTLTHGASVVKKICWSRDAFHHTLASPYLLRLAAVDDNSVCVVWDVSQACILAQFSLGNKPVHDIQWLSTNDSCRDLLAVLLSPNQLCIWNADTGIKINSLALDVNAHAMSLDPFNSARIIFLSSEAILLMDGFSTLPNGSDPKYTKYCISEGKACGLARGSQQHVKMLIPTSSTEDESIIPLSECLQVVFSPIQRNQVFLLFKRVILIVDLEVLCTVGEIVLEKATSPFVKVHACQQRDVLYVLHENGSVSVRVRNPLRMPTNLPASPNFSKTLESEYTAYTFSEPLRLSRSVHVAGMAVSPCSELDVAVVVADGRVLVSKLEMELPNCTNVDHPPISLQQMSVAPLLSGSTESCIEASRTPFCLDYMITPYWKMPLKEEISLIPVSGGEQQFQTVYLKLSLQGLYQGIGLSPTCVKMGPPVTTKNWSFHVPYLAVGLALGNVQILNLLTGEICKELSIHTSAVGGVEWINLSSIASFSCTPPNTTGRVKNELTVTEIDTGAVHHLPRNKQGEGSPISFIRVSPQRYYLIVVFQAKPMELWNLESLTLLKELTGIQILFPVVEWTVTGLSRPGGALKSRVSAEDMNLTSELEKPSPQFSTEYLTLCGKDGSTYQVSVEGGKLKNLTQTPLHFGVGSITSVSWKPELMVCGTSDGEIVFYDVRNSQSRIVPTSKGAIKKVRFAPGKGNLKLLILYNNRLDIRNALEDSITAQMKWNKDQPSVENAEWANSDKPVLLISGGVIQIWDLQLKQCQSPMVVYKYADPLFCPQATLPQTSLKLKTLLQHQSWTGKYVLPDSQMLAKTSDTSEEEALRQFTTLPEETANQLFHTNLGTAERCLQVARLFGDEFDYHFWKVAVFFMSRERLRLSKSHYKVFKDLYRRSSSVPDPVQRENETPSTSSIKNVVDLLMALDELEITQQNDSVFTEDGGNKPKPPSSEEVKAAILEADTEHESSVPALDFCHDFLLDSRIFKKVELYRTCIHDAKRVNYELTKKCVDRLLFLGQVDRAVQLLLETDSSHPFYYSDSLKACLSTAVQCSATSQSTVKLVATNLIANSQLIEGAQLLCMTGKGLDACRYMQTYGEWTLAAWLAKICLQEKECAEVICRWVDHLISPSVNQKQKAILILLSLGHFERVIETLFNMRYFDVAALFADICQQWGLLTEQAKVLVESVYLEYAQYLQGLGLNSAFRHYCSKAGTKGVSLMEQFIASSPSGVIS